MNRFSSAILAPSLLWVTFALGQSVEVVVKDGKRPIGVYLSRYSFHKAMAVDSAMIKPGSTKILKGGEMDKSAMFTLEAGDQTQELIIGPGDNLIVEIAEAEGKLKMVANGTLEQDAFNVMLSLSTRFALQMDSLDAALDALSPFDPRHSAITDSLELKAHEAMAAYNRSLNLVVQLFPGTYTAKTLVPLDKIPLRHDRNEWQAQFDNDLAFNHIHYFDYVNWKDENLLTNPFFARKVMTWLADYCPHHEVEVKANLTQLFDRCQGNPKLYNAVRQMLLEFFRSKQAKGIADFLMGLNR